MANNPFDLHSVTPVIKVEDINTLMDFISGVFDGESRDEPRYDETGRVRHAEMLIGDSVIMMGQPAGGENETVSCLHVYVPNCDIVYKKALLMGATSLETPRMLPHGDKLGAVLDKVGNTWLIVTHEEM